MMNRFADGYDEIVEGTKCRTKCTKDLFTLVGGNIDVPIETFVVPFNGASTILMIQKRPYKRIKLLREVASYNFWDFVADSGGILGVFLGFSFLGSFDMFIARRIKA